MNKPNAKEKYDIFRRTLMNLGSVEEELHQISKNTNKIKRNGLKAK